MLYLLKNFGGHQSFLWDHWLSVLTFKTRLDPYACMFYRLHAMDSIDLTEYVTPADLSVASQATFYPLTCSSIGGSRTRFTVCGKRAL